MASGGGDRRKGMRSRASMEKIRNEIRTEFRNRIRSRRATLTDAQRNAAEDQGLRQDVNQVVQEIIRQFEDIETGSSTMISESLEAIKEEVYEDQMRFETEQHAAGVQRELDMIVQNLFTCRICDQLIPPEKEVCDECASNHFNGHQ